jgi:hypothetical protein
MEKSSENKEQLNEDVSVINANLKSLAQETDNTISLALKEQKKLKQFVSYLQESVNTNFKEGDGNLTKSNRYSEYLAENVNNAIEHSDHLVENINQLVSVVEQLSNKLDNSIKFSNYLAENVSKTMAFSDYLGNELNNSINHSDYLANNENETREYVNYLGENLNNSINHSDYIAKKVDESIQYGDYLGGSVDKGIKYSEHIAETVNKNDGTTSISKAPIKTNENKNYDNLTSKIDTVIESVREKENRKLNEQKTFDYKTLLSEENHRRFSTLKGDTQFKIMNECKKLGIITEQQFLNIWQQKLNEENTYSYSYIINNIPEEYKEIWRQLDESKKQQILKQSEIYQLNNIHAVREFFERQSVLTGAIEQQNMKAINERKGIPEDIRRAEYDNSYINQIASKMQKYNSYFRNK